MYRWTEECRWDVGAEVSIKSEAANCAVAGPASASSSESVSFQPHQAARCHISIQVGERLSAEGADEGQHGEVVGAGEVGGGFDEQTPEIVVFDVVVVLRLQHRTTSRTTGSFVFYTVRHEHSSQPLTPLISPDSEPDTAGKTRLRKKWMHFGYRKRQPFCCLKMRDLKTACFEACEQLFWSEPVAGNVNALLIVCLF